MGDEGENDKGQLRSVEVFHFVLFFFTPLKSPLGLRLAVKYVEE